MLTEDYRDPAVFLQRVAREGARAQLAASPPVPFGEPDGPWLGCMCSQCQRLRAQGKPDTRLGDASNRDMIEHLQARMREKRAERLARARAERRLQWRTVGLCFVVAIAAGVFVWLAIALLAVAFGGAPAVDLASAIVRGW